MKKLFLIVFTCLFFIQTIEVNASTKTNERTTDNLLVTKNISYVNETMILSTPAVNAEEKVYDFADLFTNAEEETLYNEIQEYIKKTNLDFALVTIDENNKTSAQAYADDFYDYNDFGISETYDGILFLIDMDTREIYMSTTGKAQTKYSDYEIEQLLDKVYMYMTDKEYYTGTKIFIKAATSFANIDSSQKSYVIGNDGTVKRYIPWLGIFIFATIATTIVMVIMVKLNKMVMKSTSSREYLKKDTLKLEKVSDILIHTFTNRVRIQESSSSRSGGSSSHFGSSGISHGGGGHKF
jgi:uncharacterized protein